MTTITLPENYGGVVAVALGAIPLLGFIHGIVTIRTRKAANIPLPHSYASVEQCKADRKAEKFNCAQRAHSNYLENVAQTIFFTLFAGLTYPRATTALATAWVVLRTVYLRGYVYSDKPHGEGRVPGASFWFAQFGLWGLSVFGVVPLCGNLF